MVRLRSFLFASAFLVAACAVAQVPTHVQLSMPISGTAPESSRLERLLASRVTLSFGDMTLDGFADMLRQLHGLNVLIDHRALDDVGLKPTVRVAPVDLKNVALEEGLNLILDQLELTIIVRDSALVITTPEEAENHLEIRVYPVADLVQIVTAGTRHRNPWNSDYDTLIETITSTIAPDTWDQVGGAGSIEPFPNTYSLVIGQVRTVHQQVQSLLTTLRRSGSLQGITVPILPGSVPKTGSQPYRSQSYSRNRGTVGYPVPPSGDWTPQGGFF